MYQPPNTDIDQFTINVQNIVNQARNVAGKLLPEIILGMDHNVDLLKGMQHPQTHKFTEDINELDLLPTITQPS